MDVAGNFIERQLYVEIIPHIFHYLINGVWHA